jgi:hypothetical protein
MCKRSAARESHVAARILCVGRPNSGQVQVELKPMAKVKQGNKEYLTLSHVWGNVDIACKTSRCNLSQYEQSGIEISNLPPTFIEAILLTLDLNFQYIWIDSLCIIQDDPQDWQREAANMASVFLEATLTLSATSSFNSLGGCGYFDPLEIAKHFEGTSIPFAVRDIPQGDTSYVGTGPVHDRAWILQEELLSQRIIHAGDGEFVWQCASLANQRVDLRLTAR